MSASTLSPAAEAELVSRFVSGDRRAGDTIIRSHHAALRWAAKKLGKSNGVEYDDAYQEGAIVLARACRTFVADGRARLWTYALPGICGAVYRLGRKRGVVSAPGYSSYGDEAVVAATTPPLSFDDAGCQIVLDDGTTEDSVITEIDAARMATSLSSSAWRAAAELPERQRYIVEQRWLSETPAKLREVGAHLGVTWQRAQQIEREALASMRGALAGFARASAA